MDSRQNSSDNFFEGLYQYDAVKITFLLCIPIFAVVGTVLFSAMLWYFRYSPRAEPKTLATHLNTNLVLVVLTGSLGRFILEYTMFTVGPFPNGTQICDLLVFVGRLYMACFLVHISVPAASYRIVT